MRTDPRRTEIIRQHKHWCDSHLFFSIGVILAVFAGAILTLDRLRVDAADRSAVYIVLSTIVLATIIWNAAGMAVAQVHAILEGRSAS